jgi:hypothetical protein
VTPTQSAVLVPVPEAERAVSRHRARLDAAAALGVPAHVTVLWRLRFGAGLVRPGKR